MINSGFMAPTFLDLLVLTGRCIDSEGIYICGERASEKARQEHSEHTAWASRGEKTPFLPFSADLRWWFAEHYHAGTLDEATKGIDLDCLGLPKRPAPQEGIYRVNFDPDSGIEFRDHWEGEKVVYKNGGYPGRLHTLEIITPRGTLRAKEQYVSYTFGIREYPVKEAEDLDILAYIFENAEVEALPGYKDREIGWIQAPKTPVQALIVELAGVENLSFLMADYPEKVENVMDKIYSLDTQIYQLIADSRSPGAGTCENLSAENSGGYWDAFLKPQLKGLADILHQKGKKLNIHHDGTLKPLFGKLKDAGVDIVNGVTCAPVGDILPEELRDIAGNDIVIEGIIPQSIFTPWFSEEQFETYIRKVIHCFRDDYKIILGIGDMLPLDGKIERVEKTVKLAKELSAR
ncbi:uroporphyrinogen decarboxylase family protein [Leadbettera azotonutricia]|uniref:Uroporphyrinogen decarboxylase (URO-D) domain-containing protein n=1 Tax=Leadbettera azotonutricia (strain ATCC BAA-888 / DSM 13862 / ZAS-9) TaxID=545695 RepID=F5YD98_LEAAZ|nr:uroporphyrinogen decarboxylase family protein [Leadbettera azotonutricia]AEF80739.1 hypothetical protein TREAZ_1659 [Leadbettera azotonutricia ZAS-9]